VLLLIFAAAAVEPKKIHSFQYIDVGHEATLEGVEYGEGVCINLGQRDPGRATDTKQFWIISYVTLSYITHLISGRS